MYNGYVMNWLNLSFLSTCKAVSVLSPRCDNICIPLQTSHCYDLIVDAKGVVSRIKVIRTDCQAPSGAYVVNISKGSEIGEKSKPFAALACDFVFVDSPEGCFLIPSSVITQKRTISLSRFKEYLIKQE